jgi:hypothetical protein
VLLNYVETELAQLADAGIPFVVLSADVDLMNCPAIQSRFLNRPAANCYMGILAESLSSVAIDNNQEKQFFSNYPQIMVFQCATEELAGPFSRNCGNYRRKEVHETRTVHRHPFQLFPTVAQGHEVQRVDECNIRPEELTSLGNGLLFMGKLYDPAIRIINLRQDRRNINGPLLPTLPPGN